MLNRRDTVKLLILAELVTSKSNQREIAEKLRLTPQAISEHFKDLIAEGYVRQLQKGYYEVTEKGISWLIRNMFDLHLFSEHILKKIYSTSVIAIAVGDVEKGEAVEFWFEGGLIYCRRSKNTDSIALTSAKDGEELLIKPKEFKPPEKKKVSIFKVPDVCEGGSRAVDSKRLREVTRNADIVVSLGVEALIACRKVGINPVFFGAREVCVEAVHHGCKVVAVCTESLVDDLLRRLLEEDIPFEVIS